MTVRAQGAERRTACRCYKALTILVVLFTLQVGVTLTELRGATHGSWLCAQAPSSVRFHILPEGNLSFRLAGEDEAGPYFVAALAPYEPLEHLSCCVFPLSSEPSKPLFEIAQGGKLAHPAVEKIVFSDMNFVAGSTDINELGRGRCLLVLKRFREHRLINVIVEPALSREENRQKTVELTLERARALKQALGTLGIPLQLITEPNLLESEPAGVGGKHSGWAKSGLPTAQFLVLTGSGREREP